jgi:hypothetical protein
MIAPAVINQDWSPDVVSYALSDARDLRSKFAYSLTKLNKP